MPLFPCIEIAPLMTIGTEKPHGIFFKIKKKVSLGLLEKFDFIFKVLFKILLNLHTNEIKASIFEKQRRKEKILLTPISQTKSVT